MQTGRQVEQVDREIGSNKRGQEIIQDELTEMPGEKRELKCIQFHFAARKKKKKNVLN